MGSEVLLEQVQHDFSFRNKFIIRLPCGLVVDNNTFSKMCVFKSLTRYGPQATARFRCTVLVPLEHEPSKSECR